MGGTPYDTSDTERPPGLAPELLEPELLEPIVAPPRPNLAPRPPLPSIVARGEASPSEHDRALAKLNMQRQVGAPAPLPPADPAQAKPHMQRQVGAPAPLPPAAVTDPGPPPIAPVPPSTRSISSPHGGLGPKAGASTLSPSRTPAPLAIVSGSSLRLSTPDKPMSPTRPPSTLLAAIDANAPKTPTNDAFAPAAPAMTYPPATARGGPPAAPPIAPSSRPNTASKAFAPPAGGPPASYERAFRQWSSPNITTVEANNGEPVTFQVYTAQDISAGRAPMRSLPMIPPEEKKASLGARIAMVAVGVIVVLLTGAAVIAVSTEDPKPLPNLPNATIATATPAAPSVTSEPSPAPPPTAIMIGDPVDDDAPVDDPSPPPSSSAPKPKARSATTAAPAPSAPASLKSIAPPPNPYGK